MTSIETPVSVPLVRNFPDDGNPIGLNLTPFDQRHYLALIRARGETIRKMVAELKPLLNLTTALDVGCGVGFFAQILHDWGLEVHGFDGRLENVVEARNRFPRIPFAQRDIEDREIVKLGEFDLVLCFGLLYHLENPMLAIRHLRALTGRALLLESMCVPGGGMGMMLREEPRQDDQSLTEVALYPSENCLAKMLYRAGFAAVYKVTAMPDHEDFRETREHARRRTVLFASVAPVLAPGLQRIAEPRDGRDPWAREVAISASTTIPSRVRRFLARPAREKYVSLALRARRVFPEMRIPLRLPFGAWWLAERSGLDHALMYAGFESTEMRLVERLLRPGMTVLDIGAHHGLYTLLAAKRVGRRGRVIAFEPSARERKRLLTNVRLNRFANVRAELCALGDRAGEADLFLVDGPEDWYNSLRPPAVEERTCTVRVEVRRLDDVLETLGISRVDFIKLDVEGAELSVLRGAAKLLHGESRPAILAEVQDVRTRPWGYWASDIIQLLASADYRWFGFNGDGGLEPVSIDLTSYDANLVALPVERADEFLAMLGNSSAA